jgi:CheY-like chemotaxis protein
MVFVDLKLPDANGTTLLDELRQVQVRVGIGSPRSAARFATGG